MIESDDFDVDITEYLEKGKKIEEDPKISFDDWYQFPPDWLADGEIPVPYPHSAWYHELEKSAEMYFNQFKWVVAPIRVELDVTGAKNLHFYGDGWKNVVGQLPHQMYALRTFAIKSACRMPANGLFLLTGKQSNVLVLDIDVPVDEGFRFLRNNGINIYADNLASITRSAGNHFYFKWKNEYDEMITTRSKFLGKESKVDIRGNNGIIILPPTRVYNRDTDTYQQYKWDPGVVNPKIHDVPGGLHDLLVQRHHDRLKNHQDNTGYCRKTVESLTSPQKKLIIDKINGAMDVSTGYRSEKYFEVACLCVKMAVKNDDAYALMKDLPKIKERGRDYFDTIYNAALHSVDTATYNYKNQNVTPVSAGSAQTAVLKKSLAELTADINGYRKTRPPIDWVVPGLFGRNQVSIWYAPGGLGKTIIMTETGINLASGKPLFGGCISHSTPCRVLILHYDLNDSTYTDLYISRMRGSQNLTYYCASEFEDRGGSIRLFNDVDGDMYVNELMKEVRPDWVLIDTIDAAALGMDINKQDMVQPLMFKLKRIARDHNCHIALIRHPRKKGSGETAALFYGQDDLSGSDAWTRFSDFTVVFNPIKGEDGRPLKGEGVFNFAKVGILGESIIDKINFKIKNNQQMDGSTTLSVVYNANTVEDTDSIERVILYKLEKSPLSRKDLLTYVKINRVVSAPTFDRKIKNMVESGYIETYGKTRTHQYQITPKGLDKLHESDVLASESVAEFRLPIDIAVLTNMLYKEDLYDDSVPMVVSKQEIHENLSVEYDAIDIVSTINQLCASGALKQNKDKEGREVLWVTPQGLSVVRNEKYRAAIEPLLPSFPMPTYEEQLPAALYLFIDIKDGIFGTKSVAPPADSLGVFEYIVTQGWAVKNENEYILTEIGIEKLKRVCRKYINRNGALI